jgi:hypothetical protein
VCSFVCCVSFDRGVILYYVCYLVCCVLLYYPFAVQINNNNNSTLYILDTESAVKRTPDLQLLQDNVQMVL